MTTPRPPQPPVMALIEQRRRRLGMSMRTAASLADISDSRWRQLEAGGREVHGMWISEDAPAPTLARMALAVRLNPGDLEPFSPDAAAVAWHLAAEREAGSRQDAEDAERMAGQIAGRLSDRQRSILVAELTETLRRLRQETK